MADDQDPQASAPDPTEDTPEDELQDTAEGTDSSQTDWEAKYKEAQQAISRQGAELAAYRRGEYDESDEDEEDEAESEGSETTGTRDVYLDTLESQSWTLVERTYGQESIDAYRAAYRIWSKAQTPMDHVAAFEAYHEIRSGKKGDIAAGEQPGAAPGQQTRQQAVEPRVDTNRSDSPDSEKELAEAVKSGKLEDFVKVATRRMGF